jgi:regulator of replication initiation timing
MNARQKFSNFMNEFFGANNKIVFDFENVEIDFYEIAETAEPKIGDKANYNGKPANGEILSADGTTMVFENGVLIDIVAAVDDENENLKLENKKLLDRISELENSAKETTGALNKFKNLYSDFQLEEKKQNGQNHERKTVTSAFSNALKNLK